MVANFVIWKCSWALTQNGQAVAALADQGIRVNAVAPGPIWTPLTPSTFSPDDVKKFGCEVRMKRVGQPHEVAPCYRFLASTDSSLMTGQVLHPVGEPL